MRELTGEGLRREDATDTGTLNSAGRSVLHPRRWLRISLRGLLTAVGLLCVYMAWLQNRVRREHDAVAELAQRGYRFWSTTTREAYYPSFDSSSQAANSGVSDSWWALLPAGWNDFGTIDAVEPMVNSHPDDIPLFFDISRLRGVTMRGNAIGYRELQQLLAPRKVQYLVLDRCNLTKDSLGVLSTHDELRTLRCSDTLIMQDVAPTLIRALPNCEVMFDENGYRTR